MRNTKPTTTPTKQPPRTEPYPPLTLLPRAAEIVALMQDISRVGRRIEDIAAAMMQEPRLSHGMTQRTSQAGAAIIEQLGPLADALADLMQQQATGEPDALEALREWWPVDPSAALAA